MARIEYVRNKLLEASLTRRGELVWELLDRNNLERLPQIFWEDGRSWIEVNVWALDRAASRQLDPETIRREMKHLRHYAEFLETSRSDWRHFPMRKEEQVLRQFRKSLVDAIHDGRIAISTAAGCMNAVVQFYRFAEMHSLVGSLGPLWRERMAVIPYFDASGFQRTLARVTTDLKISARTQPGNRLEGGLQPLRAQHMKQLLEYTLGNELLELHLMLAVGFFTGARIGTVVTLTTTCLRLAREDPLIPGLFLLRVGPGTGVATKFSVSGEILIPRALLSDLLSYATSAARLLREAKADRQCKNSLFLNRNAKPYTVESVNRLVYEMRRRADSVGLAFMRRFRFHQSRASFGTWLMQLLLESGSKADAIRIVRDAMLHKSEQVTMTYLHFLEQSQAKLKLSAEFNEAFTGIGRKV